MFGKNKSELRKERSEKILAKHKVMINPHLPRIEDKDEAHIKSPEEIVKRAVTAFITTQIAIDICTDNGALESAEFFMPILERFGLADELTEDEKPYFDTEKCKDISKDAAYQLQWRIEMCMPLFWACGFWKELDYPKDMTDTSELVTLIDGCDDFDELMKNVKMRSASEMLDLADLLFRMDWACVEARIKNDPSIMGDLSPDVVVEQHKGINWIIGAYGAENWDTVAPHT